jgi:hypothetical protein
MNIEQMNTIVETIVNECESIICETENITEVVDLESFAEELLEIRITAEELQTLILNIEESEYISNNMLDNLENKSIQLYQEIKYSFDNIETPPYDVLSENESSTNPEVIDSFVCMRDSINAIRDAVYELVTSMKVCVYFETDQISQVSK